MMVGDHLDDLKCGSSAGCVTVLLNDLVNGDFKDHSNYTIDKLDYLIDILNYHNNQVDY
jgi:phosphoglycolate phosphatase-like HAD superfamily hydrolase